MSFKRTRHGERSVAISHVPAGSLGRGPCARMFVRATIHVVSTDIFGYLMFGSDDH